MNATMLALISALATAPGAVSPPILKVDVPMATADAPQRVQGLAGATNFRDLGGYRTTDGTRVRYNTIYRSNTLAHLTPADEIRVGGLQIRSVVDLRTAEERHVEPDLWLRPPADIYESPKEGMGRDFQSFLADVRTPSVARDRMIGFYARMPDLYRPEYAAFFRRLADDRVPLLVHCTAGKDRTGVASALLLEALHVPRPTIDGDYALTEQLLPRPLGGGHVATTGTAFGRFFAQLPPEVMLTLWRSDPAYVDAALGAVDREYGSIDGYLTSGLGLTSGEVAQIRRNLTD